MEPFIYRCGIPPDSIINQQLAGARFIDCQRATVSDVDRTALRHFLILMVGMPGWIDALMMVRNRVVQLFGLKDLGCLTRVDLGREDASYGQNDRVGIFTLTSNTPDEVLVADLDKHLDVYLSLSRLPVKSDGTRDIVVSTVVRTHNLLGRVYMLPVGPFHKIIAPLVLAKINR